MNVVGVDVVELAPIFDIAAETTVLAATDVVDSLRPDDTRRAITAGVECSVHQCVSALMYKVGFLHLTAFSWANAANIDPPMYRMKNG